MLQPVTLQSEWHSYTCADEYIPRLEGKLPGLPHDDALTRPDTESTTKDATSSGNTLIAPKLDVRCRAHDRL